VQKIRSGEDYQTVAGTWQKHNGQTIANPPRLLVGDLDSVPYPDYDWRDHAILICGQIVPLTYAVLVERMRERYLTLTTRGCPFQCNYCFNHAFRRLFPQGPTIRKRSIANVMGELKMVLERFATISHICIADDALFLRPDNEIEEFSRQYKAHIRIPMWVTGTNPSTVTARKLAALADGGMDTIRMGIQTASPRIQKLYARKESNQQARAAAQLFHRFRGKIKTVQYDILLDNPWETDEDLRATLLFMCRLPVLCEIFLFPLILYPGTDLEKMAVKAGIPRDQDEKQRLQHHRARQTYLNAIFFLLSECAHRGQTIPLPLMFLMTQPLLIRLGVSRVIYRALKAQREGRLLSSLRRVIARTLRRALHAPASGLLRGWDPTSEHGRSPALLMVDGDRPALKERIGDNRFSPSEETAEAMHR
jgi:pyruvate-formate lyase-activating enzyme